MVQKIDTQENYFLCQHFCRHQSQHRVDGLLLCRRGRVGCGFPPVRKAAAMNFMRRSGLCENAGATDASKDTNENRSLDRS
jgi:hypothetical protein